MSVDPSDAPLLGLVAPDEAFRQAAREFMRNNAPSTQTAHLHPQLQHFITAFFATTQDLHMQEVLLLLHNRYGLGGMVDPSFIIIIQSNVMALQANRTAQTSQLPIDTLTQMEMAETPTPAPHSDNSPSAASYQLLPRDGHIEATAAPSHRGTSNIQSRPSTVSVGSDMIHRRDPTWLYKCDLCGHRIKYQSEFHRHFRQQSLREGFKITGTTAVVEPYRWHGEDRAGNEYTGEMMRNEGGHKLKLTRIPPPCGGRFATRPSKREQDGATAEADEDEDD